MSRHAFRPRYGRAWFSLMRSGLFFAAVSVCLLGVGAAQTPDSTVCKVKEPPFDANRPNIFSELQEQWLGDSMAAQQESEYRLLPKKDTEELTRIGDKLLDQLPRTVINYQFRVYDSDELNGFSLAGGYIYVSRKLIIDAKSEDELAGVLAHEIGHIYTHQIATAMTRQLDKMLHVHSLGDREDVFDKFQRLLNAEWKYRSDLDLSEQEKDELRADAVGLYAMARAGYAPRALATNLERIADSRGRNGNFLSDVLGGTSEVGMRVRAARGLAKDTSDACRRLELKSSPQFLVFQQWLIAHPGYAAEEATPGLNSIDLVDPVRPGLNSVRFSPDGKYLLAQNENYVYVMSSSPLKQIFKVYAPGAGAAHFTPDSKHLVFHYQSLRVESWDAATGEQSEVHELVEYQGCLQSELSPDGKVLACVFYHRDAWQLSLELFDVSSGKVVLSKDEFFLPDMRARIYKIYSRPDWDPEALSIAFSPDSRYVVVAGSTNNFAVDLQAMRPVKMAMDLGHVLQGRLLFASSGQLVYDCDAGQRDLFLNPHPSLCIADFPDGRAAGKFTEGWEAFAPVAKGNYLLAQSFADSLPHLVDASTGKPGSLLKFSAADVYGNLLASESGKGGVTVGELGAAKVDVAELPTIPLPYVRVAQFSPDGKYLALSNENRGAIWNLAANRQIALTRSFRGAWFDETGGLFLQVTDGQARPGQNIRVDLKAGGVADTGKYDYEHRQLLDISLEVVLNEGSKLHTRTHNVGDSAHRDVTIIAYDQKTGSELWQKRFSKDSPLVSQQEPGVLVLTWGMERDTAWDELAHSSVSVKTTDVVKEVHQGLLTELVDSHTGTVLRQVISPEGSRQIWGEGRNPAAENTPDERSAKAFGDLVVVHGNEENSVVYDARTGKRLMAFWGRAIAGDGKLGWIAATNRDQDIVVYDTSTGNEMAQATLDNVIEGARFIPDTRQLIVVANTQKVYTLDLTKSSQGSIAMNH
jgi:WD40 repeat protein